jgi:hypothetical protein
LCCLLPFGVGSHQKVVGVTSHAAMVKKYVSSCIPLFQISSPSFNSLLVSLTGRYGLPEEVAGLVKFLALDPAAAYITGQVCPAALVKFSYQLHRICGIARIWRSEFQLKAMMLTLPVREWK